MKAIWNGLAVIALLAYPLVVYTGIQAVGARSLALLLLVLMLVRFFLPSSGVRIAKVLGVMVAVSVVAPVMWFNRVDYLRYYPVLMNLATLGLFSASLFAKQTVVEKIARLTEPQLSAAGVLYTRRVTKIWCAFFVINGAIAFYTAAYSSFSAWALYNGMISYVLMGALFTVEFIVRIVVKRRTSFAQTEP